MPRILEVRVSIASNYVSEFHSKLKAFMGDSNLGLQVAEFSNHGAQFDFDWGEQSFINGTSLV